MPLASLLRGYDLTQANRRLAEVCSAEGLPFVPPTHAWDTRLAQELALWADDRGGPSLHRLLFQAVFVQGTNVGDPENLVAVAVAAGHPEADVRRALAERPTRERIDAMWTGSRRMGVTGVPTYAVGRMAVVGAQPYPVLEQLATRSGVDRRP